MMEARQQQSRWELDTPNYMLLWPFATVIWEFISSEDQLLRLNHAYIRIWKVEDMDAYTVWVRARKHILIIDGIGNLMNFEMKY